jgi:hypothetical protein
MPDPGMSCWLKVQLKIGAQPIGMPDSAWYFNVIGVKKSMEF